MEKSEEKADCHENKHDQPFQSTGWQMTRTEFVQMMADDICGHVIGHLKTMYPDVWKELQPSTRVSLKGCLKNSLLFHLAQLDFTSEEITQSTDEAKNV